MIKPEFSYLSGFCMYILFLQVMVSSEKLRVTTPTRHVLARVRGQAELSCQVIPPRNVAHMEVRWFRSGHSQPVYLYRGHHNMTEAAREYVNRAEFVKEAIGEGKVTLRIHNISISDDGSYQCLFNDSGFVDVAGMNLSVAAVGLETEIHVQAPDADGVMLECNSGGWFPKPHMEWRDSNGEALVHSSKLYSQDEARLFHMKMTLLTNRSQSSITCCIFNPVTGEEKQTSIILANELFTRDQIWMKILVFIACIQLLVFLLFISCFCRRPDPQFLLYNNWIAELGFVILILTICFAIPIIHLLVQISQNKEDIMNSQRGLRKAHEVSTLYREPARKSWKQKR